MINPFYTHRPFLIQELDKIKDRPNVKILEFGVGDGSSEILNDYASKYKNLNINAYETEIGWLNSMRQKYELSNYKFHIVENWDNFLISDNFTDQYDLIFIDQAPWEARIKTLDLVGPNSKITILHDYDYFNHGITPHIYSTGTGTFFSKYSNDYKMVEHYSQLPPTLIFQKYEALNV